MSFLAIKFGPSQTGYKHCNQGCPQAQTNYLCSTTCRFPSDVFLHRLLSLVIAQIHFSNIKIFWCTTGIHPRSTYFTICLDGFFFIYYFYSYFHGSLFFQGCLPLPDIGKSTTHAAVQPPNLILILVKFYVLQTKRILLIKRLRERIDRCSYFVSETAIFTECFRTFWVKFCNLV